MIENQEIDPKNLQVKDINAIVMSAFNRFYLVISTTLFFGVAAVIIFGIVPNINNINESRRTLTTNQQEYERLADRLRTLESVLTSELYLDNAETLGATLYDRKPFLELLWALSLAGSQYNIAFEQFEFRPGLVATEAAEISGLRRDVAAMISFEENRNNQYIVLEMRAAGNFISMNRFLHALENTTPITSISYVSITQRPDGRTLATIEAFVHYHNRPVAVAINSPLPLPGENDLLTLERIHEFTRPDLTALAQVGIVGGGNNNMFLPFAFGAGGAPIFNVVDPDDDFGMTLDDFDIVEDGIVLPVDEIGIDGEGLLEPNLLYDLL